VSLPYFNLYPRDFEADTSHLSLEEDGAYNRLLRLCWMSPECSLPDDDAWIMRRMRVDEATYDRVVRPLISEFFSRKSGRVSNPRLSKEFSTSTEKHGRRVSAGKAGGEAKARKTKEIAPSNAVANPYQPEPEPEPDKSSEANASGADAPPAADPVDPADPAKAVFDAGVRVLGGCGVPERQARSFIGKLRKANPGQDGQILSAIMDCGRAGAVDPIPWLEARMKPKPSARLFDLSAFGTQPQ
jgi:uncharacterized protein YdaU (DUF1376 family)